MGQLIATGGYGVDGDCVQDLEDRLEDICRSVGFPANAEFKWSPRRDMWMYSGLVGDERCEFYIRVLNELRRFEAKAIIVIEDEGYATATRATDHLLDASVLFLERVESELSKSRASGLVIVDRPGGGRTDEDRYLDAALETILQGTEYVPIRRISLNVLSTPSRLVRCLQGADLVVSATTSAVAGEDRFAPVIFEHIKPLICSNLGRIGGGGLKIHPDYRYRNLYHWVGGDTHWVDYPIGVPMPLSNHPYCDSGDRP